MKSHDRRLEARRAAGNLRARVRPGHTLTVVDVSAAGALVEAGCQLRPGAQVEVHLERDEERRMVRAMVSRCSVATIDARAGVLYRAALSFAERCEWVRETATREG